MGFLIDTNVLSEFRKGSRADKGVQHWFAHAKYSLPSRFMDI